MLGARVKAITGNSITEQPLLCTLLCTLLVRGSHRAPGVDLRACARVIINIARIVTASVDRFRALSRDSRLRPSEIAVIAAELPHYATLRITATDGLTSANFDAHFLDARHAPLLRSGAPRNALDR